MKLNHYLVVTLSALAAVAACVPAQAQQASKPQISSSHSGINHDTHTAGVHARGDQAMGFSHTKTTHRFRLLIDGGAIEVTTNDANDAQSRNQIRGHLRHIVQILPTGNFDAPMLTHGRVPPGVPAMKRLKAKINYKFEGLERGGRVRITTTDAEALAAVHEFLRFQIEDHQTGDSPKVERNQHGKP